MVKLNFEWSNDGKFHQYCELCHSEAVERIVEKGKTSYICATCHQRHDRSIVIDPGIIWWVADDGEYWHESSGIFVRNPESKFLFYERLMFPFAITVPAGHVDTGETPIEAARREVKEEVGLAAQDMTEVVTEDIPGDSCRRGADIHRWHAFLLQLREATEVKVTEADEGHKPTWLTIDEALGKELTVPVRHILSNYRDRLLGT